MQKTSSVLEHGRKGALAGTKSNRSTLCKHDRILFILAVVS
jgi:hypothetical protein